MADNRPHWADSSIAIFTGLMLITYLTGNYFSCQQFKLTKRTVEEVRKGGTDTHELAVQAKNQADRTKDIADSAVAQAKATNELAIQTKRSADAAKIVAGIAQRQLEMSERPWVGIAGGFNAVIAVGSPLSVTLQAQNVGKTPALNLITTNILGTVGPNSNTPSFEQCLKSSSEPPAVLFPGSVTTIRVDTAKASQRGLELPSLQSAEVDAFKNGTVAIYVFGCIWYDDTLHRPHRTDYCFVYDADNSKRSGIPTFRTCKTHNYAD